MFSYGSLAVVLFLYLEELGFSEFQIGQLLTYILLGDLVITMWLSTLADRMGRKKILVIGALLKLFTGCVFALSGNFHLLILSGIIGVISTSGGQIGPFISVEQTALTELKENISSGEIASLFGWYNLFGYMAQAAGSLFTGIMTSILLNRYHWSNLQTYRVIMFAYVFWAFAMFVLYMCLSSKIQSKASKSQTKYQGNNKTFIFGIKRRNTFWLLVQLSLLFALDSFAGGFVMQTFLSFWFQKNWGFDMSSLGVILMLVNVISGLSGLCASTLVNKIGAIPTMIVTHLPSHIFLILIPMMPSANLAIIMLFLRSSISTMDVPARQAYVATLVDSDQRSAAGGITTAARSLGLSLAPLLLGKMIESGQHEAPVSSSPFYLSGALLITYNILLFVFYVLKKKEHQSQGVTTIQISTSLMKQVDMLTDTTCGTDKQEYEYA